MSTLPVPYLAVRGVSARDESIRVELSAGESHLGAAVSHLTHQAAGPGGRELSGEVGRLGFNKFLQREEQTSRPLPLPPPEIRENPVLVRGGPGFTLLRQSDMGYLDEVVVTERLLVNRVNPALLDELLEEPSLVDLAGHGGHDRNLGHRVKGTVPNPLYLARREEQSQTDECIRCRVASRASRVLPSFFNTVRYLAGAGAGAGAGAVN